MTNTELLIEGLYVLLPCLLIVLMFYIESNVITERERETREYVKIFFVSFLLIGIARYCFTFYYNHRDGIGSSTVKKSKSISVKTGGGGDSGSSGDSSSESSPLETISNTVSTIVEKIAPPPAPAQITNTVTKVVGSSINPNLPDF
jgi:FlaA1/EpsC-like NDP-sugar epimerase